jgi:hypothetical protein
MGGLSITDQFKVALLQKKFLSEFGLNIRIYDGRSQANPDAILANLGKHKGTGKAVLVTKNTEVGDFEDKFMKEFGLKVEVFGSDDSYLCNKDFALNAAQQADTIKLARKSKIKSPKISSNEELNITKTISKSIKKEFGKLGFGETAKVSLNFSKFKSEDINETAYSGDINKKAKTQE